MPVNLPAVHMLGAILLLLTGCQTRPAPPTTAAELQPQAAAVTDTALSKTAEAPSAAETVHAHGLKATQEPASVTAAEQSIWPNLRGAMALSHQLEQRRVQQEIRWLLRNPRYLERLQPRMQKYLPYLLQRTVERGLPGELALIPIVESALDPYAFSPGGASGLWQFMRPTALQYGLTIDRWYDGRRDLIAATEAALDYLEALHTRLGQWPLAIAAYNSGGARVQRAVRRANSSDFFALRLPRETQYYLPKVLALAALISDPEKYAVALPEVTNEQSFALLQLPSQFDLQILSDLIALPLAELQAWNPALKRWATPALDDHRLIVPLYYKEAPNEQLDTAKLQAIIAATQHAERMHWNEIIVRNGDSLSVLAERYNTDIPTLKAANRLRGTTIRAGKPLLVPVNQTNQSVKAHRTTNYLPYTVQSGDSLWSIAKAHNVSIASLVKTNRIAPREVLPIGRKLNVPTSAPVTLPALGRPQEVTRKVAYTVRKGDSLARIAKRFGVGVAEIARWNRLDLQKYLQPGQRLTVYVDAANT